jgi:hypothetical protein
MSRQGRVWYIDVLIFAEATMTTGGTQSNWKDHVLTTIIFYTKIIKIIKNYPKFRVF